jgi:hypothetical protein
MIEATNDLWLTPADARCITTNGTVKPNGRAVMGRGCAKQATERYFAMQLTLGTAIKLYGNHVLIIDPHCDGIPLVSFPVKYEWSERADLDLIARSAHELVALTAVQGWTAVVLPRPGCGNGKRHWESEVRPILQPLLDDRFTVVTV